MSKVIKVENLGKKYIIGHQKQRGGATLRDAMTHTARGIWQRMRHPLSPNRESIDLEDLWALKDINFEVQQGERIGIIGANGAGKSTLLKVLSRITEPTTGKVRIKGRVSSLLEVGTGFHPELTGRENIFLNGAILGMTRQEVKRKFDEIIAFAELEKFLDTPVKRYSSGMYVRLAFAVAAHLEPEILIVDEVLAVGDAAFQKKCLGKMENVAGEGRTVLFVSHNMAAVQTLCERCMLIDNGYIAANGSAHEVIDNYLTMSTASISSTYVSTSNREKSKVWLKTASIYNYQGVATEVVHLKEPFSIRICWILEKAIPGLRISIRVNDGQGTTIFSSSITDGALAVEERGVYEVTCRVEPNMLVPGRYTIDAFAFIPGCCYLESKVNLLVFEVVNLPINGGPSFTPGRRGVIYFVPKWSVQEVGRNVS